MKYFLFFIFISLGVQAEFDGYRSAGVENFKPGNYFIKGYLRCNRVIGCELKVYHKTTRQYTVKLKGDVFKKYKLKNGYYSFLGEVKKESLGDQLEFHVISYPIEISEYTALKYTVRKVEI